MVALFFTENDEKARIFESQKVQSLFPWTAFTFCNHNIYSGKYQSDPESGRNSEFVFCIHNPVNQRNTVFFLLFHTPICCKAARQNYTFGREFQTLSTNRKTNRFQP